MCFYGDDGPEWYREKIVLARKQHRCAECQGVIPPATPYHYVVGKWDGDVSCFKVCPHCYFLRKAIAWVEIGEGCDEDESQPFLGDLAHAWNERAGHYAAALGLMDPEAGARWELGHRDTAEPPKFEELPRW